MLVGGANAVWSSPREALLVIRGTKFEGTLRGGGCRIPSRQATVSWLSFVSRQMVPRVCDAVVTYRGKLDCEVEPARRAHARYPPGPHPHHRETGRASPPWFSHVAGEISIESV